MNYTIKKTGKPAYMQLYEQLRADVTGGVYAYGSKLPSKRLLAEETGVSVITAEHACAILADEGYVEPRERSGYYVTYRAGDFLGDAAQIAKTWRTPEKSALIAPVPSAISYPTLARTARRVISEYGERLLVKSPNSGIPELRTSVADYLARSGGLNVSPEQIVIGSGAEYLYTLVVQLLGMERTFAVEDPSYEKIRRVYRSFGAKVEKLPLTANGISREALENSRADVLHITPFNSYPSGVTADASKRREYLNWARRRGGYVIEDNYDSELTVSRKNDDTVFSLDSDGRVIYLNTFSHTVAPSIRVGYMLLPRTMIDVFNDRLGFLSCTVPVFEQFLIADLLSSGEFERHINRVRRRKRRGGI